MFFEDSKRSILIGPYPHNIDSKFSGYLKPYAVYEQQIPKIDWMVVLR